MELTVLGCFGPYPPAGGACSGYLLREGDFGILIDCGNGVLSRLQRHFDFCKLKAVILTHLHPDHFADILIMRYGLSIALQEGRRDEPLDLYAPGEPKEEAERLPYKDVYSVMPIVPGRPFNIGPFIMQAEPAVHPVCAFSLRIETSSGTVVYSGDTEYCFSLENLAYKADLFLCEANYQDRDIENNLSNHLSSSQAAMIAAAAGVKRLLLTHHHPGRDRGLSLVEAGKYYPGVEVAVENQTYTL